MRKVYAGLLVATIAGGVVLGTSFGQSPELPKLTLPGDSPKDPVLPPLKAPDLTMPPAAEAPVKSEPAAKLPEIPAKLEMPALDIPKMDLPALPPVKEQLKEIKDLKDLKEPAKTATPEKKTEPAIPEPKKIEAPKPLDLPKMEPAAEPKKHSLEDNKKTGGAAAAVKSVPAVSIEAIAPGMVALGQNLTYELVIRNVGPTFVQQIRVDDEIPSSAKYLSSDPPAEVLGDRLQWSLGSLEANGEKRIRVSVKPGTEAEFHSKPTVTFSSQTSMQVQISRPKLQLDVVAAEAVSLGDEVVFDIKVTNTGNGAAQKLLLEAEPSKGLSHPQLQQTSLTKVQAEFATLQPGETKSVKLRTQAIQAGQQTCNIVASTFGAEKMVSTVNVQILQPNIQLKLNHPQRCMVRAEPVFKLELHSNGSSPTPPVQMAAAFPEGLEFISASDNGVYDPVNKTVTWSLPSQPAGGKKVISIKARANAAGNLAVRAIAQAGSKIESRVEGIVAVEGVPALQFEVNGSADPVELGKETVYEVKLVNKGTCACTNIRLQAILSDGLTVTGVTSPVPYKLQGTTLNFDPLSKLGMKGEQVIRVKVTGGKPGDQRFKALVSCDQIKQPVVKEESTSFYQP